MRAAVLLFAPGRKPEELLPRCHSFVCGAVDSDGLALNGASVTESEPATARALRRRENEDLVKKVNAVYAFDVQGKPAVLRLRRI